ncbi:MAG: aldo/keto reductase [Pseudomonadota bacterium]
MTTSDAEPLRWGILATGAIAHTFARALATTPGATLAAVAGRTQQSVDAFAERHRAFLQATFPELTTYGGFAPLLADPAVDVIYVASPHPAHAEWTIRALEAGKHVLCEKPMGMNHAEVMAMVETARAEQRFLMEAFMYRCHPQTLALKQLVDDGAIGELRLIQAAFGFQVPFDAESRLFANALGGGGIMDVGCYPLSIARYLTGEEPSRIFAQGHLGATGVDEWAHAQLHFGNGVTAQIGTGVSLNLDNRVHLFGSAGRITVGNPWHCADASGHWQFRLQRQDEAAQTISGEAAPLYQIEAEEVARCISAGLLESPHMTWQDSLNNAIGQDRWRKGIGLVFEAEAPEQHPGPLRGSLKGRSPRTTLIPQAPLPALDRNVSRLVMGCDNQPSMAHASALWDHFFESGGNCFDTAWLYGGGSMEQLFGHWHQARGIRDEVVLIGKGAHTPHCTPEAVHRQLDESLDRLQTDYVDVYFLHRDNPDIPVGEFVSALNDEQARGRIRTFGGSNWTLPRLKAANDWAATHGQAPFRVLSNNFSLAHMVEPIWAGTETSTASPFRAYLESEQIALFPWSAQARGFFTPWVDAVLAADAAAADRVAITTMQPDVAELRRTWFSDDNFERRRRAQALADERGVDLIQVALAYVAAQAFPCFPLIGARIIDETRSSAAALEQRLGPAECAWLDLRGDRS